MAFSLSSAHCFKPLATDFASRQRKYYSSLQSTHSALNRAGGIRIAPRRVGVNSIRCEIEPLEFANTENVSFASYVTDGMRKMQIMVGVVLIAAQVSCALPVVGPVSWLVPPAEAVLYSPDTKVPRTGELALRKAIPANPNMKNIQNSLEDISYLLRIPQRKPFGTMEGNVKKALKIAKDEKDSILANVPADLKDKVSELYASLIDGKGGLEDLIKYIKDKDPDRVSVGLASSLDKIAEIELLQVMDGSYNGSKFNCTDQAIISDSGSDRKGGNGPPLEIMPSGQFEPLYKTKLSVQDGELPVLPLSVYGSVAMAHSEVSDEYSSPDQFFFYLYDKSYSGLGGLSFDEGQFSVFGYATTGRDILPQIKTGDIIKSATLVDGGDRLIVPEES